VKDTREGSVKDGTITIMA